METMELIWRTGHLLPHTYWSKHTHIYIYSAPHIMSNMYRYVSIYMWHMLINLVCFHLLKVCPTDDPLVLMHFKIPMNVAQCKIKTLVKPYENNLCLFL